MSTFKSELNKEFKKNRILKLPEEEQKDLRRKTLEHIIQEIGDKKNRFVFYCPDIAVVNPLVKIVYEVAYEVKAAGYNVVMLHEVTGFKAKWLYNTVGYENYSKIPVEYIISKKGESKKTKKTDNKYSFKISDTLIVTDAYQDMLDNLMQEESMHLLQKIVLVTGYMGLSSLRPGTTYDHLGVNSLIFFDEIVKNDYAKLFQTKNFMIDNYMISSAFREKPADCSSIYPTIAISSIGNNEQAQQLINVFYNRYPHLSMFTFNVIPREDFSLYVDTIEQAALVIILDKNIVTKQNLLEIINLGTPILLQNRREFLDDKIIFENFVSSSDVFEMADEIAKFCQYWLTVPTTDINDNVRSIASSLGNIERTHASFYDTVSNIFYELNQNRLDTFTKILANVNG